MLCLRWCEACLLAVIGSKLDVCFICLFYAECEDKLWSLMLVNPTHQELCYFVLRLCYCCLYCNIRIQQHTTKYNIYNKYALFFVLLEAYQQLDSQMHADATSSMHTHTHHACTQTFGSLCERMDHRGRITRRVHISETWLWGGLAQPHEPDSEGVDETARVHAQRTHSSDSD